MAQDPKSARAPTAGNRRAGGIRITECKPTLTFDGKTYEVNDFSKTGFEAKLPPACQTSGFAGTGTLEFDAVGYHCVQEVEFKVRRVTRLKNVAATYTVLSSTHEKIGR